MSLPRRAAGASSRPFCSAVSSASDEPLAATASRIDHWILVEYRGAWTRDVLGGSLLTPELKTHLREQIAALGRARLLFVRKPERRAQTGRRVLFGTSRPGRELLLELEVDHPNDLIGFDFAGSLADGGGQATRVEGPFFVVCTHGKRDRCCARHGRPLYDALRRETETDRVWQSTHVGGDRFAGNVVVLPDGLYYGRVAPGDVAGLYAEHRAGRVDLDRYRGRSAHPFPVQAAEQELRASKRLLGIGELELVDCVRRGDEAWRIRFRTADSAVHELDVEASLAEEPRYLTCESPEPQRPRRYAVTAHRVL